MQAKGFGIKLDLVYLTENELASALERNLKNPSYKKNILNAYIIFRNRSLTPVQRATWWIDHVIKYGGEHLQPPVARLPLGHGHPRATIDIQAYHYENTPM